MGQFLEAGLTGQKDPKLMESLRRIADKGFLKASFTKDELNRMLSGAGKDLLRQAR